LLAFIPLEGRHTGANLAQYVEDTIEKFDIAKKLFCITTDAASNNKTLIVSLANALQEKYNVHIDLEDRRVPCLAHIINLAVSAFLQNLKVIEDEMSKDDGKQDEDTLRKRLDDSSIKDFALTMMKIREIAKVPFHNTKRKDTIIISTNAAD
jgi:hypothetical protein